VLLGCATAPPGPSGEALDPGPACAPPAAGLSPEEDGYSLAALAPGVPQELEALAAFVAARAELPEVELGTPERGPTEALASLAGPSTCLGLRGALRVAGSPPRLFPVPPRAPVDEALAAAGEHLRAGRFPEARQAFFLAGARAPLAWPRPLLGTGDAYAREERWGEAIPVYREAVARFPWDPAAHASLGYALRQAHRRFEAIEELGRALALAPRLPAVRAWLADDRLAEVRPSVPPPAVREQGGGRARWHRSGGGGTADAFLDDEARAYAGCKEAFRASPALREAVTGQTMEVWRWSPAEESVCAALWVRAYLGHRGKGRAADAGLDDLWDIAQRRLLDERALFDVGARAHPSAPALLDPPRRERLFRFVAAHRVLRREGGGWFAP
jgi:tetratricopeptide (TPR) repeat protein